MHLSPNPDRGTGRTLRMCLRAIICASENDGHTVWVLAHNWAMTDYLWRMFGDHIASISGSQIDHRERAFKLPNNSRIRVRSLDAMRSTYDEAANRIYGCDPKMHTIFLDHAAGGTPWTGS